MKEPEKIIISRTDSIGDVMLTLPLAGILKKHFPNVYIYFLGSDYTKSIIESCVEVDEFISIKDIQQKPESLGKFKADAIIFAFPDKFLAKTSKNVGIKKRIGTSRRIFHWLYLNERVRFSRKKSLLHESELNQFLLLPFGINEIVGKHELVKYFHFKISKDFQGPIKHLLKTDKIKVILHPKSKGSAREWDLSQYEDLIKLLPEDKYSIFITGTGNEKQVIEKQNTSIFSPAHVTDLMGKMSLLELTNFIQSCDVLVACSTGPLHIAGLSGIHTIGLYPPVSPIHSQRWAPIGNHIKIFEKGEKDCKKCINGGSCDCINSIESIEVANYILGLKISPKILNA